MDDFILKDKPELDNLCLLEIIQNGACIYGQISNGDLDFPDLSVNDYFSYACYFCYVTGINDMRRIMTENN